MVDDGSEDRTAQVAESFRGKIANSVCFPMAESRKGLQRRHGSLEARGEIVLFTDADLSAPIEEADKLFAALRTTTWPWFARHGSQLD